MGMTEPFPIHALVGLQPRGRDEVTHHDPA
jgi:hypothetical protein